MCGYPLVRLKKHNTRHCERGSARVKGLRCSKHNTSDWSTLRLKTLILARMNAVTTRRNTQMKLGTIYCRATFLGFKLDIYMKATVLICMIMVAHRESNVKEWQESGFVTIITFTVFASEPRFTLTVILCDVVGVIAANSSILARLWITGENLS